jgi:hypothetical protein
MIDFTFILILATDIMLYRYLFIFLKFSTQKMKNKNYLPVILFLLIIFILLLQSCIATDKVNNSNIIQKRKYMSGFYFNTIRNKIKIKKNLTTDSPTFIDTITIRKTNIEFECFENFKETRDTNCLNLIASIKEIHVPIQNKKLPAVNNISHEQKENKIIVRRISNKSKKQIVPQILSKKSGKKPKVLPLAIIGFSLSIIGLLCLLIFSNYFWLAVISGLIIELAALIISIISLEKINKNPTKLNGKAEAVLGIIFSTVIILSFLLFYIMLMTLASSIGGDFVMMI